MFWTDWGEKPKIERAEMDGSNRQEIISQDIYWPNGVTMDYSAKKIYWTDAKLFYIDKANYDGSQREKVFRSQSQCNLGHPFDLTLYENKIYWTDWKSRGIHSSNKNDGMRCQLISQSSYPHMGIKAFESTRQKPRPGRSQQPQQIFFTLHIHNAHLHFSFLFDLNRKRQVSPRSNGQPF